MPALPPSPPALEVHGGIREASVVAAGQGKGVVLVAAGGRIVRRGVTDRLGSKVFRGVRPRRGYRIRVGARTSKRFRVLRPGQNPPAAFFRGRRLHAGLNYVRVRDGVEIAMTVRLPLGKTLADGPFPTVVEYSGYPIAPPHDLLSSLIDAATGKPYTPDPLEPSVSTAVGSVVAPLLGFATVSVQMRGTGCSGGAFDLFGLPTTYDGYDAIETVAAQPWVLGRRVGLVGLSFSGITQLFAAGTRPPHLAAVTPMSVTDDTYSATGFPGGILNSGFALDWTTERRNDSRPAPQGGQEWARILARTDAHCRRNQRLRLQSVDPVAVFRRNPYRTPSVFDERSPATWMKRITAPVFLAGAFQDEQTGGHFARSLGALSENKRVWFSLINGVHSDSLGPTIITRWYEFLSLYVARRIPVVPDLILQTSGALYEFLDQAPALPVEQSRFAGMTDVAAAKRIFDRDPRVRLLMDSGAGSAGPGSIGSTWELGFDSWPIREAKARTWFLGPDGRLEDRPPPGEATASYVADPKARPAQTLPGDGAADAWKAQPPYRWAPVAAGKGLGFVTPALDRDVVIAGPSSLEVALRSSAPDTDLQVTLSEVRPDGEETYVQTGWLRASHRVLDRRVSTVLDPVPTHRRRDAKPLPAGRTAIVRVPVFPVAHAFRAGSRIRVTVQAPGGDRPRWSLASIDRGTTTNQVVLGGAYPSRLILPVLDGVTAQGTPLPPPTALRGEPSRTYVAASNGG